MKLEQRPTLKQTQIIAPQQIQSLKMLAMPILKLEQMVRQELSVNPMLEEVVSSDEPELTSDEEVTQEVGSDEDTEFEKIDWETYLGEYHEYNQPYWTGSNDNNDEKDHPFGKSEKNLYEYLNEQLGYTNLSDEEKSIGEYIIGNLDDAGFLACDVSEMAEALSVDEFQVWKVLCTIQKFDPPGIAARSLKESLLIQLNNKEMVGTLPYLIVSQYFEKLDKLSHNQLAKFLRVPQERIEKAFVEIKKLNPRPATSRFGKPAASIVPDLIVDRIEDDFVVYSNDKNLPHLRVSNTYRKILGKKGKRVDTTQKYIKEKLDQAKWLLSAINHRRATMLRVMEAIVHHQKDFFEHGDSHIKPLKMQDIADELGMDVSTVFRVASGKYVQTPMGVYEIKYFFNSGVQTDDGEELSRRNVKLRIKEIISAEDSTKPLPDQKIKEILAKEGINIARRTVSKYREELRIKPARFRKRVPNAKNIEG